MSNGGDTGPLVSEPAVGSRARSEESTTRPVSRGHTLVTVALAMLSAGYYFHILIILDVVVEMIHNSEYSRAILMRMWNAILIGEIIGQVLFGILCDNVGPNITLCTSTMVLSVGSILGTAARGVSGDVAGTMWLDAIARGIIGVGIGGIYPPASMIVIETQQSKTTKSGRVFILMTNAMFSAGAPLATILFLIVLSAVRPGHLDTVWPVCVGIGLILPTATVCYFGLSVNWTRYWSVYSTELKRHWITIVHTCCLSFIYNFVAYPKIIFSSAILFAVVDGDLWRTTGFQLLLGVFALSGSLVGAMLYTYLGRRRTMVMSFISYVIIALIMGCAYGRLVKIVPLFVILYAFMLFMGNMGPGNLLGLITAESYPGRIRGSFYGFTASIATVGAVAGIHAFSAIEENLRKQWVFIIAAICGAVGIFIAYFLPPDATFVSWSERELQDDKTTRVSVPQASFEQHNGHPDQTLSAGGDAAYPKAQSSVLSYIDDDKVCNVPRNFDIS
ncbi:MFS general substrate transporter [Daedalea quercina L-15889]|uniref:MFS general substrate transporter n=1 Tax=Daedalea quercina L-15889 TaxID=1314783 RepID=A0A165S827_9APHY|nr:MFS general substrate transporter [Daedalea quercina L-15889]